MINLIFGAGSVCFSLALLPAIWRRQPPPLSTCLLTAFWLWAFVGCYLSLGYDFSFLAGASTAALWTGLAVQCLLQRPARPPPLAAKSHEHVPGRVWPMTDPDD